MRLKVLVFVLLLSGLAQAQTIVRVQGKNATLDLKGTSVQMGDEVIFFDAELNEAGRARITKITPQGTQALAEIGSGKPRTGMTFEKSEIKKVNQTPRSYELRPLRYEQLSSEERRILDRGEISQSRYVIGGVLGTYPLGLGIGHAIQGRYTERGWIFTAGQLASLAVMASGFGDCLGDSIDGETRRYNSCNSGAFAIGALGYLGFRIWEIIDVWVVPPQINRRYRNLKSRLGESESVQIDPILIPQSDGARLGLRWSF